MGHVATGSLLGNAGEWGACGWSVVQLDYDGEMAPLHGMCGSMQAVFEVRRTIRWAELTAFPCLLNKVIGACVQQRYSLTGHGEERKCIDPNADDADLWIEIREELHQKKKY